MQTALSFVAPVLVCLMAGIWLDRHFGTSPLYLFIGLFLGFGTGLYSVYRQVTEQSDAEAARSEEHPGESREPRSDRDDARW